MVRFGSAVSAWRVAPPLAVGMFAVGIELHYGRLGYMPIDHSVVFDGGWRTLSGQVPFRDYTTPNAITPSLIQAVFFALLGVTWFAYVLHAAVVNALFALLVYVLLRLCGGGRAVAVLYGGLSAVVFYPPIGVPFHDQTSFFFTTLAITIAVAARRAPTWRLESVLWAAVPFALVAAAFSKQTPAVMGAPVVLALAVIGSRSIGRGLIALAVGSVASLGLVVLTALAVGVDWELVRTYFIDLPLETGRSRGQRADSSARSFVGLAVVLIALVAGPPMLLERMRGRRPRIPSGVALPLTLSATFLVMCAGFMAVTLNEPGQGMPLLFASFGLFHIAVLRALPARRLLDRVSLAAMVSSAVALVSLAVAASFNTNVNERRSNNNLIYDEALVEDGLPSRLSFMRFQVPPGVYPGLHAVDIRRVVSYLRSSPGNFLLFGDNTVINGVTGKPSVFPALYITSELTIPKRGTLELDSFQRRMLRRIASEDVRRVVVERRTWESVSLDDLPQLRALIDHCGRSTQTMGFFMVVELANRRGCP